MGQPVFEVEDPEITRKSFVSPVQQTTKSLPGNHQNSGGGGGPPPKLQLEPDELTAPPTSTSNFPHESTSSFASSSSNKELRYQRNRNDATFINTSFIQIWHFNKNNDPKAKLTRILLTCPFSSPLPRVHERSSDSYIGLADFLVSRKKIWLFSSSPLSKSILKSLYNIVILQWNLVRWTNRQLWTIFFFILYSVTLRI